VATGTVKTAWQSTKGGFFKGPVRAVSLAALIVAILWLAPGCPAPPGNEKLTKDVETLKAEVATLKERVDKLEAAQKILTEMLKIKAAAPPAPAAPATPFGVPGVGAELPGMPPASAQTAGTPLTVAELFRDKDKLLGTRVTVRGLPGPVIMHKKTLFMEGPGGLIEVIYGNLQDKKQVDRITAQSIDVPITVSGILSAAPGPAKGQMRLIIMADSVEF
jgi:outer membrane murein-binding lipoprotein Lpp